jgi:hypothetical protein
MEQERQLISLSNKLLTYIEKAHERFELSKLEGIRGDFPTEVKPFADEVKDTAGIWKEAAVSWVNENRPKNLHSNQIETAADYLEVISVQAFFPETSRKRFIDQIQSVQYILRSVILAVESGR